SSVACNAVSFPDITAFAISEADRIGAMARSGDKDAGRLGLVGQRKLVDEFPQPQRHLQVRANGRFPSVLDSQRQRLSDGCDVVVDCIRGHVSPVSLLVRPATADAESPSATPLYSCPADCQARLPPNPAPRSAPCASRSRRFMLGSNTTGILEPMSQGSCQALMNAER